MVSRLYPSDKEARSMILDIGRRMYQKNYVAANDGNISCKVADDIIWATPTGVSKGFMDEDSLVKMRLNGEILESGGIKPSSEVKMHIRIYKENSEIGGVCHAHTPVATAFAVAGISLDKAIYPEALVNLGTVPCAPYEVPGSEGVPNSIAPYCRDYNAALLGNHGPVAWGKTLMEAFYCLEAVEHYAMIMLYTGYFIGKANVLDDKQVEVLLDMREKSGKPRGGKPSTAPWPKLK